MMAKNIDGLEVQIKMADQMQSTKTENEEISANTKRWALEVVLKQVFIGLFSDIHNKSV